MDAVTLWSEVSKEIDLAKLYFITRACDVYHMLIMSYGGEEIPQGQYDQLKDEIRRSIKEVEDCGVVHGDLRPIICRGTSKMDIRNHRFSSCQACWIASAGGTDIEEEKHDESKYNRQSVYEFRKKD
ncbi:hypothetical protein EsDP_00002891 [Epichloe bromicola]|uniref:Protein kinase domain-containing protein n=1 Tax=Epichloe bromicola TaxID=79588 RepID=A0ABQ0CM44_9HYPO